MIVPGEVPSFTLQVTVGGLAVVVDSLQATMRPQRKWVSPVAAALVAVAVPPADPVFASVHSAINPGEPD